MKEKFCEMTVGRCSVVAGCPPLTTYKSKKAFFAVFLPFWYACNVWYSKDKTRAKKGVKNSNKGKNKMCLYTRVCMRVQRYIKAKRQNLKTLCINVLKRCKKLFVWFSVLYANPLMFSWLVFLVFSLFNIIFAKNGGKTCVLYTHCTP